VTSISMPPAIAGSSIGSLIEQYLAIAPERACFVLGENDCPSGGSNRIQMRTSSGRWFRKDVGIMVARLTGVAELLGVQQCCAPSSKRWNSDGY
jgi:hypothetical protein